MAKKAAARKSAAKKRASATTRKVKVEFKRLHDEMDAALAKLKRCQPSTKRDDLIKKIESMRSFNLCPSGGMFVEL